MNGGETIINRINADGDAAVAAIKAEADKANAAVLAEAEKEAQRRAQAIADKTAQKCAQSKTASKSRCDLAVRSALLRQRRSEAIPPALPEGSSFCCIFLRLLLS